MFQPRSAERTLWSGHRYSPRRVAASIAATVALVGVFSIDYTAATAYAAVPAYAQALNDGVPLTAAHRGDPVAAPENTVPAIRAAINGGADIVEFDLQLTRDGHAVVMHDDTVDRTTDGEGRVSRHTLDEIRALDAGSWFGDAWRGTRVPTAEEALSPFRDVDTTALVEFKGTWSDDDIAPVLELIDRFGIADRTVVASFEARTMLALKRLAPELQRALTMQVLPASPLGLVSAYDATLVVTSMRSVELSPRMVGQLQRAGITVIVYTLNSQTFWRQARVAGVDAIVTDDPRSLGHWSTWLGERGW
ncbi:MAG TPA: glycerophosphodiester phosphodiesterase family protein [Microcella sp.]|nr:glycerophosphodiester phosphodiesterase family protein [Microcella sp.]